MGVSLMLMKERGGGREIKQKRSRRGQDKQTDVHKKHVEEKCNKNSTFFSLAGEKH